MKQHEERRFDIFLALASSIGGLVVTGAWLLWIFVLPSIIEKPELRGVFGDSFGGINALFSGLAFLGVILAILLQKQELKEQRLELRQARIAQQQAAHALEQQLKAAHIRARIDALNLLLESRQRTLAAQSQSSSLLAKGRQQQIQEQIDRYEAQLSKLVTDEFFPDSEHAETTP